MSNGSHSTMEVLVASAILGSLLCLASVLGAAASDVAITVAYAAATVSEPHYDLEQTGTTTGVAAVALQHDDSAGIAIAPTNLTITEPHGAAAFTLTLSSQPSALVLLPLSASNDECAVVPELVVWGTDDWDRIEIAIVGAIDDEIGDGDQICVIQTGPALSNDPNYDQFDPPDVIVRVVDDEVVWRIYLPQVVRRWPPIPDPPSMNPIVNPDGDGEYTVSWSTAALALTYALQEATYSSFADASEIYAGTATHHDIGGRGAARYYYRVQARNAWGASSWSSSEWVDVLREAEPNDDAKTQANGPVVCGLTYYGTFPSEADIQDYFFFNLSRNGSVELWLSNIPVGQNHDLVLRNAALEVVGYSAHPENDDEHIETDVLSVGRYYVQVYRRSGSGGSQPYHLRVECE